MASSRRTYDTDVITLRKVFAKDPANSNVPALRTLTADGQGGTYWAVPSTLGVNPAFNRIVTSAGTYTADLSYNTFRLTAGENIGMANGTPGSNETYLFAKAFSQLDVSGENSVFAFTNNQLDSSVTLAGQGGITLRADPATNTLFFVGPASNAYTVSTGIYGFNQLKVIDAASSITSSIQSWTGDYLTATSPSTLLTFVGYNDIQMSTNVTTNSVFFTISTFTSKGYLDISAQAYSAYPSSLSTVSSLYVQIPIFNSTIGYLSSTTGFSFSSVVSSINALAMSTGDQFYILTGLINARATIVQLNDEISNVNMNLQSTSIGLGTLGYISTGGGGAIGSQQLVSTVEGLGSAGYLSTAGGGSGDVTKANLTSTVAGLGTSGYVSSLSTIITSTIFNTGAISTYSLEVFGPATLTNSGSTILRGPIYLGGPTFVAGSITGASNTIVAPVNLASTVAGLGTARYVSSTQLQSSMAGIGSLGYLSALRGFSLSSGNVFTSSLNLLDTFTSQVNFITISSGSLLVNGAKISGGGGGGGAVAQLVAGTGISLNPPGGTGVVTITNTGPTTSYVDTAISSFSTALGPVGGGGSGSVEFSTISTSYGTSFTTFAFSASTMTTANILPSQSNTWVAVGYGTSVLNSIQTSGDGRNWSNSSSGGFSSSGKGVAYNGSLWVAVGNNGGASGSIQVSTDGVNWSNATTGGFSSGGNGVAYNGSYWIAVGNNGSALTSIQISTDGYNWSAISSGGFSTRGNNIAWNGSYWVAVGQGASATQSIQYSIDGRNWSNAVTGGFSSSGKGIAWNGSFWVAAGDDTTRPASLQYSGDGRNWSNAVSGGFLSAGWNVAWNGKLWVAVGDETTALKSIQYSVDGSNWNDIQTGGFTSGNDGYGIVWNGSLWVATGIGGSAQESIQYSRDGVVWSNASSGGFASGGVSVGFSSNLAPGYSQQNLTILSQNIPLFLKSTNQIMAQPSSLLINTTLLVDTTYKTVGINCNTPAYTLDVNGIGHFLTLSTLGLNISSINGVQYNDPGSITSTVAGLGQIYVSTASLVSTTRGLQTSGFLSTSVITSTVAGLGQTYVSTLSLVSTTLGLQTSGFLSTSALTSTTFGLQTSGFLSTPVITSTVAGLGQTYVSTLSLVSTTLGLQTSGFLSTSALTSTTFGLQTSGFLSTPVITSTVAGLGQLYISSLLNVNTLSTLALNVSSINGALPGTGSGNGSSITVSTGQLYASSLSFVNVAYNSSNVWLAVGNDDTAANTIQYSIDGANWSPSLSGAFDIEGFGIAYDGKMWVAVGADSTASIKYSYDGKNWSNATGNLPTAGRAVAWNGKMWVAVGYDGTSSGLGIKYSYDGIAWTNAAATTNDAYGVAWNGSIWVVASDGGGSPSYSLLYSYYGTVWSGASSGGFASGIGIGVAWNGRMWVAVGGGSSDDIKYSYDGKNWLTASSGFSTQGKGVAWNGRMWVAVGVDATANNTIKYSYDGINWSNSSGTGYANGGYGIAWNGLYWVAVGSDTYGTPQNSIRYSVDGISWTPAISGGFQKGSPDYTCKGSGVAYSSNLVPSYNQLNFEIEPQSIPVFIRTKNQMSFTPSTIITNNTLFVDMNNRVGINTGNPQTDLDVAGTGRFFTLSSFALNVSSINGSLPGTGSGNGSSLTVSTGFLYASSMQFVNVAPASSNLWVAAGNDGTQAGSLMYSGDGITWSNSASGAFASGIGFCVAYNGTIWVAGGVQTGSAATIKYSRDGLNWSNASGVFTLNMYGVAWNGRLWVGVGGDSASTNTIKYSGDGINWSNSLGVGFQRVNAGNYQAYAIAWNGSIWVAGGADLAAGSNNTIKYSLDGSNWTSSISGGFSSGSFGGCVGVAWNGHLWVATGNDSTTANRIKYSFDGLNWSNASGATFGTAGNSIAWNGRMFLALGDDATAAGSIKYSYDGITWSNSLSGGFSLAGVGAAWNGNQWVAAGQDATAQNMLKYSFDGINWSNSVGGQTFTTIGYSVAFSSNTTPSYRQESLDILPQNIPLFYRSTNQIFLQPSSLVINNTLQVDTTWGRVGINTGHPQTDLDVAGTGRFFTLSSFALNISSINGALLGYGNGSSLTVSTGFLNASSIGFVNIAPTTSNLWVMPGANSVGAGRLKYSYNGITWTNTSGATFSSTPYSAVWNGSLWLALGTDVTQTVKYSYDGITWANVPGAKVFSSAGVMAAWNGRMWVAVGNNGGAAGGIQYSYDGFTWNSATGFTTSGAYVAWNGYMWVAVGNDSTLNARIKYSYDGINWSNSASGAFSSAGYGVAWNGQIWVAVGNNSTTRIGSIKYSRDGINWSNNENGGFVGRGWAVGWNGQLWVAVGNDGDVALGSIQTSTDGIRWSSNTGFSKEGHGVTWNGSLWVAGGEDATAANRIKYSYDGITWFNSLGGQTFDTANGGWIAGYSSNIVPSFSQANFNIQPQSIPLFIRSTNQFTFLQSSMTINNTLTIDITDRVGINTATPQTDLDVNGTGRFTTVSTLQLNISSINGSIYSAGGGTATGSSIGVSTGSLYASSMSFVNIPPNPENIWIATGYKTSVATDTIRRSSDGLTWGTATSGGFTTQAWKAAYNGILWVVGGDGGTALQYSTDGGVNWVNSSGTSLSYCLHVSWNGSYWLAGGAGSPTINYSLDGRTWLTTGVTGDFGAGNCGAVAWNGSIWVAVGNTGSASSNIKWSANGRVWNNVTTMQNSTSFLGKGVAWNGRLWVAVGDPTGAVATTAIQYSGDGVNWSNSTSGGFNTLGNCVAWNGKIWVAGGNGGATASILYSYNGTSWTLASGIFTNSCVGVAWNGSLFVATGFDSGGTNNTIKYSGNGINWSNSSGTGFANGGNGVAYSSNVVMPYRQLALDILPQNIPLYFRSTNQIFVGNSNLLLNNTLQIDQNLFYVGVNCNTPAYTLDVNGTINAFTAVKSNGTNLTSDRRIKQFITTADLDICYSNVKNLPLRRFEFIDSFKITKFDGKQIGFIADEVEQYYPKAVNLFSTNVGGFSTIKHLNYDQIFFANYGATKKLMDIVESQDSTIKGQAFAMQTLLGTQSLILSTLNGLQGR